MATKKPVPAPQTATRTEAVMDWFQLNSKQGLIVLGVMAVIVAGWWFYSRTQTLKAERAEKAYFQALQSVAAGNTPLAISDLRKMAARYPDTRAGIQGRIALTQMLFDDGKYADGIAELNKIEEGDAKKSDFGPAIHRLTGAGLENQNKFREAAVEYQKAADLTNFTGDRGMYRGDVARALTEAGDRAGAVKIWTDLANDDKSGMQAEARIRLGELTAAPAPRS